MGKTKVGSALVELIASELQRKSETSLVCPGILGERHGSWDRVGSGSKHREIGRAC